jgi:hypothetical protein
MNGAEAAPRPASAQSRSGKCLPSEQDALCRAQVERSHRLPSYSSSTVARERQSRAEFLLETEVPPTRPRVRCLFARIAICGESWVRGSLPPTGAKQHPQCLLQKRDQTRPVMWFAASPRGDHPAPACPGCWGDEYSQHAPSGSRVGVSQLRVSQALMQKRVPPRPLLCAAEESARCRGRGRNHLPAKLGDGRRGCFSILSEARTAWLRTAVIPVPTLQ